MAQSGSAIFSGCVFLYLVVEVPGLVVLFRTQPVEDGLVVDLDELPFRPVAEVSEKPRNRVGTTSAQRRKFVQNSLTLPRQETFS